MFRIRQTISLHVYRIETSASILKTVRVPVCASLIDVAQSKATHAGVIKQMTAIEIRIGVFAPTTYFLRLAECIIKRA